MKRPKVPSGIAALPLLRKMPPQSLRVLAGTVINVGGAAALLAQAFRSFFPTV